MEKETKLESDFIIDKGKDEIALKHFPRNCAVISVTEMFEDLGFDEEPEYVTTTASILLSREELLRFAEKATELAERMEK